jgi:hypothetical protein
MGGACSTAGRDKKHVQNFDWQNWMKERPLRRRRRRWEDNIRMDPREIGWEGVVKGKVVSEF